MTRWVAPIPVSDLHENPTIKVRRIKNATIPEEMRVRPLQREEFKWPNFEEIKEEQKKWLNKEEFNNINSEGLIVTKSGKVIIPERSEDLKIRLCVIAHSGGNSGHLGYQAAARKLAEFCWWSGCERDMLQLCNNVCIACQLGAG